MAGARFGLSGGVDAGRNPHAAKADGQGGTGGGGRGGHERGVWAEPANSAVRVRAGAADRVRQCGESTAGARGGATGTNGDSAGGGGDAAADHWASADGKRAARRWRRDCRAASGRGRGAAAAGAGVS